METDVIVYSEQFGPKVLMNWFFKGQQVLFKKICFEYIKGISDEKCNNVISIAYDKINKKHTTFELYERKRHESNSGFSYQEVVLNMKDSFDIQSKIFIDFLLKSNVDEKFIMMLKNLHLCVHMSSGSGLLYYDSMKEYYLNFIEQNNIDISYKEFNILEGVYSKCVDYFMKKDIYDDAYYLECKEKKLFMV